MVRRQTWQARRFKIFESARHFQIELNRDVRFKFESNLEASQVPKMNWLHSGRNYIWTRGQDTTENSNRRQTSAASRTGIDSDFKNFTVSLHTIRCVRRAGELVHAAASRSTRVSSRTCELFITYHRYSSQSLILYGIYIQCSLLSIIGLTVWSGFTCPLITLICCIHMLGGVA